MLKSSELARPAGFEPATRCLEGSCSVRLSYGRPEIIVAGEHHASATYGSQCVATSAPTNSPVYEPCARSATFQVLARLALLAPADGGRLALLELRPSAQHGAVHISSHAP